MMCCQEDNRTLQASFDAMECAHKVEISKLHTRLAELEQAGTTAQESKEAACESPNKTSAVCSVCMDKSVKIVFPCGHAKCADCANELVGRGLGCPECRAPMTNPMMLFLNVG